MKSRMIDPFEKLIISLYTYCPPRRKEDYYSMYNSNNPLDQMFKENKNTKNITLDC